MTERKRSHKTRWTVRAADRIAAACITVGGVGTILAVSGVLVFLVSVVIPRVGGAMDSLLKTEMGRDVLRHAIDQQQAQRGGAPPAGPQPSPAEFARLLRGSGTFSAIFFLCLGSIYPLVVLILLTRPGARAACLPEMDFTAENAEDAEGKTEQEE